jgi:N-acetylneuraminic acid mutarotase
MAVGELDGKIYVIGGYPANRISVATVQVYDPATDSWRLTTPLPMALNHIMAASANGRLYVIGGQPTAEGNGPFVNTVYEYDPAGATWTTRAPMPTARSSGAAAVIDGRIYVAGGRPPRGSDFAVYDPRQNAWRALPNLPTQRNHLAAAAIGGRVYVVGGRFGAGFQSDRTDAVEVYDPAANTWTARAQMPRPRGGVNGLEALGCVHIFGGEGNPDVPSGVFPDHDVYNPQTNTWTKLAPMPIPVHGVTGAAFVNGLIYLPGGGTSIGGSSGSTHHQVYRPSMTCR